MVVYQQQAHAYREQVAKHKAFMDARRAEFQKLQANVRDVRKQARARKPEGDSTDEPPATVQGEQEVSQTQPAAGSAASASTDPTPLPVVFGPATQYMLPEDRPSDAKKVRFATDTPMDVLEADDDDLVEDVVTQEDGTDAQQAERKAEILRCAQERAVAREKDSA